MKIKDIFEKNKFKETQGIIVGISGTGKQYNMEDFIIKNNLHETFIEIEDINKKQKNK